MNEQELVEKMCQAYFETIYGPGNWTRMDTEKDRPHRGMQAAMKVCIEARDAQIAEAMKSSWTNPPNGVWCLQDFISAVRSRLSEPERVERVTVRSYDDPDYSRRFAVLLEGRVKESFACEETAFLYARGLKAELADKE